MTCKCKPQIAQYSIPTEPTVHNNQDPKLGKTPQSQS